MNKFGSPIENGIAVDRIVLSVLTGSTKVLDMPEVDYQNSLLKTRQILQTLINHQEWVSKLEENLRIFVRCSTLTKDGSVLFSLIQSSALPMIEYMISHYVNVSEARASGGALKLSLSIDKVAKELVERSHERQAAKDDNLSKTRAALAEEKNKSATAKKALIHAQNRIEMLSVQIESVVRKTTEREQGWKSRMDQLKQQHQEYVSGLEAKYSFELAEAAQEVASFAKSSSSTKVFHDKLASKARAQVEKQWKKKMKEMKHKHLIEIEELKEQHEASLSNILFERKGELNSSNDAKLKQAIEGNGESNQAVEKLKERIAFLEIENKKLSQMHRNEQESFSKTKVEGEVSASDTWSHTIIAEASDLDANGISKIMLFEEQLKEAERENKRLSDQIKSLQNAGSRNNASKAGSMLESKYNELNRQYKNILNEHNALKADFDLRVERKVEVAVGEYKKAMIEVVQSQASNVNRDKKKLIKDAIERERRMSAIKIDEMRESVARETFIAMKSDAVVEGREAMFQVLEEELAMKKTEGLVKLMRGIYMSIKGEEEVGEGMKQLAIKKAVANAQKDILKDSNAEHEILLLEQRANFESQINIEAEGYEKQIINLRKKADIEIAKARGDAKEFEIKLGEAIKEIQELKKKKLRWRNGKSRRRKSSRSKSLRKWRKSILV